MLDAFEYTPPLWCGQSLSGFTGLTNSATLSKASLTVFSPTKHQKPHQQIKRKKLQTAQKWRPLLISSASLLSPITTTPTTPPSPSIPASPLHLLPFPSRFRPPIRDSRRISSSPSPAAMAAAGSATAVPAVEEDTEVAEDGVMVAERAIRLRRRSGVWGR